MTVLRPIIYLLLTLLLSPCVTASIGQEYVVVVHKDSPINAVSANDLKRMFLGKAKKWSDGSAVLLVMNPNDAAHAEFTRTLLHKSPRQLNTFWRKNLYSGRSMMPYLAENGDDLLSYLGKHKNAISYQSQTDLADTLKSLRVTK